MLVAPELGEEFAGHAASDAREPDTVIEAHSSR